MKTDLHTAPQSSMLVLPPELLQHVCGGAVSDDLTFAPRRDDRSENGPDSLP
ncbi:hypothetical protein V8J88_08440 [Massilia sp. W12]|uniref:hypothetical protein n=1 Tax=Massilia sp. W12 TaxID=3126507 RepID=UPI0030CA77AD